MQTLPKRYHAAEREAAWQQFWREQDIYAFKEGDERPVYSIDTPPPTVSGDLHLGHCYSYGQTDLYARFHRMNGKNVFYPMGFDDNGLPTERLVESRIGITPDETGTGVFLDEIRRVSEELEVQYEQLWRRLGLSVDWHHAYRTISEVSRRTAQRSFLDLSTKGYVYRSSSPTIWCPSCRTAIANAEVSDLQRETKFVTILFRLDTGGTIPIATTRPELLPACVAVFVNPDDERYRQMIGAYATTPVFNERVPILCDPKADPEKGTGIVMCCTFGDTTDIAWWREHNLPLKIILGPDGRLTEEAGILAGMDTASARKRVIGKFAALDLLTGEQATTQTVSVHERCDTPVEYLETNQWFVAISDRKQELIEAGRAITWHPAYMQARYEDWINNLEWDWCISRQRHHGVPFPVWYCTGCGEIVTADPAALPVDPRIDAPETECRCGSRSFIPETSIMDTWMTSSMTPQIAGGWLDAPEVYRRVYPMAIRPQAHDIIRTWAFYTILKSQYHFGTLPWHEIVISGHGLSPEGHKVSKSRGSRVTDPMAMADKYSADAIRYWAASSKFGEDSLINEEKIAAGQKLVNKLWSVTRFAAPFLEGYVPPDDPPPLRITDRWLLSELQRLIVGVTESYHGYDHPAAKASAETFFLSTFADNYLEMVKSRLYDETDGPEGKTSARYALFHTLLTLIKLCAPVMPYITEEMYQVLFHGFEDIASVHISAWPVAREEFTDTKAESVGRALLEIAASARRYKSERQLSLGSPLERITVATFGDLYDDLRQCAADIRSVTRAKEVLFTQRRDTSPVSIDIEES